MTQARSKTGHIITVRQVPDSVYEDLKEIQKEEQKGAYSVVFLNNAFNLALFEGVKALKAKYARRKEAADGKA